MRKLIAFLDTSIDGFMAGPDNDLGFVANDPRVERELPRKLMDVTDTIIFGRKSFPDSSAYWMAAKGTLAEWMNRMPKLILSSSPGIDVSAWSNAKLLAGDGVDHVRRAKSGDGASIVVFGGVGTVRSLVAADLVNEYWLKVNPTVVGRGGAPFADIAAPRTLTLLSAETYPSGTVALIYGNDAAK